ncbi:Hydrophobic surface binding protein [Mycena sanguinolenta]|uniref:Hydrophobic surface binding protein n=1 Tax=Mycena sanguinolenta TaxID=230812 RepID=A0A8H6XZQ5_9AGAR|nr:Hydrophobic surface binding protein [Mycena sanguinolenta]
MVQFTRLFVSLCLIAASASAPTKRTVAQVEADIAKISSQVTALDNDIKGFPASGLPGVLNIHSTAQSLQSNFKTATSDVKANGAFNEADGTTILNDVLPIQPVLIGALSHIAAQKPAFANVPGAPSLILSDLRTLKTDEDAFGAALIAAAPADLEAQAVAIQNAIDTAFDKAIAAYA